MGKGLHTIGICAELLAELFPESEPMLEGISDGVRACVRCVRACFNATHARKNWRWTMWAARTSSDGNTGDLGGRRRCYCRRAAIERETPSEWTAGCCGGGRGGIDGAVVVAAVVVRAATAVGAGVRNRRRGAWEEPDRRDWGLVVPAARSGLRTGGKGAGKVKLR